MRHALSTLLKSWLACTALVFAGLALALPTPKDIELAVSQGQLTQAESMLREVIAAKPQSAKAQYELGQVLLRQNRLPEAKAALQQARSLDPSLKFASSDKQFQDLMDRTQAKAKPARPKPPRLRRRLRHRRRLSRQAPVFHGVLSGWASPPSACWLC